MLDGIVLPPDFSHHSTTVAVLIGPPSTFHTFHLPKAQLEFWSPYLRTLIDRQCTHICISLPEVKKEEWMVFVSFMKTCRVLGRFEVADNKPGCADPVPLVFRVWVLSNRLKGPAIVMRDACMQLIYKLYMPNTPMYPENCIPFTPSIVRYMLNNTKTIDKGLKGALETPLMQFIMAMMVQPGIEYREEEKEAWDTLLLGYIDFRTEMGRRVRMSDERKKENLGPVEAYLGCLGEIFVTGR